MAIDTLNAFLKESDFSPLNKNFSFPEISDDSNEPFIEKLILQQEQLNGFRDIWNPGVSYGFYHYL